MGKGGETSDPVDAGTLQADAAYTPFLQDTFDATEFASNALVGSHTTAQAQTRRLQDRIQGLQLSLREEVLHRRPEVLQQAAQLRDTEAAMQGISLAVETVQAALQRAKALVMEPYSQLQLKTRQLRNLHSTVELLRHVIQRLKLVAKLKQQIDIKSGGYQDLAKVAKLLADIETISSEADVTGIDVIEADNDFLQNTWQDVLGQAEASMMLSPPMLLLHPPIALPHGTTIKELYDQYSVPNKAQKVQSKAVAGYMQAALQHGIETLSQAEVGSALQVCFNLGLLTQVDSNCLSPA